jgi:hypothetical protein
LCKSQLVAHAVDVASDELQPGVGIGGAAGVGERYPAVQVERGVGAVQLGDVVGFPGEAAREVRELDRLAAGARGLELGDERRAVAQVGGHAVVDDAPGQPGLDAVADAQHHAGARREHRRRLDRFRAGGGMRAHDAHVAADVLLEQLRRREQVEVEVLLDQGQRAGVRQASQQRGLRAHAATDLAQRKPVAAGLEGHAPLVLHQREALVVDRDRDGLLVGKCARLFLQRAVDGGAEGEKNCRRYAGCDFFQAGHGCCLLGKSFNGTFLAAG